MKKRGIKDYVWAVVDFLNCDFNAPLSTWKDLFFPHERKDKFLREGAKRFQDRLRNQVENALKAPRKTALEKLAHKFEGAEVAPLLRFEVAGLGEKGDGLDFGDEKFVVGEKWKLKATEQKIYCQLYVALRSGEFSLIKKCRQCSRFFTSYRHGTQACSPKCNRDYHNSERQKDGSFRNYYHKKKQQKLKVARKLKSAGKSRNRIMDETGLTEKALIRAGVLDAEF